MVAFTTTLARTTRSTAAIAIVLTASTPGAAGEEEVRVALAEPQAAVRTAREPDGPSDVMGGRGCHTFLGHPKFDWETIPGFSPPPLADSSPRRPTLESF